MTKKEVKYIPEINIRAKLKAVSDKGFIKTLRKGDTGIGFTLESELGISENNLICHDLTFKHEPVELKAQRKQASSNITLITKSPHWDPLPAKEIIEKYGYPDYHGRQGLKVTLKATEFNAQGLKLELKGSTLSIIHKTDGIICYFLFDELVQKLRTKLSEHLLLVLADTKKQRGTEYFHFNEAIHLIGLSEKRFKQLLSEGTIVWEFRMHLKETGGVRDHGAGFRLNKKHIDKLYEKQERIL
jgi:hypothetical protein